MIHREQDTGSAPLEVLSDRFQLSTSWFVLRLIFRVDANWAMTATIVHLLIV